MKRNRSLSILFLLHSPIKIKRWQFSLPQVCGGPFSWCVNYSNFQFASTQSVFFLSFAVIEPGETHGERRELELWWTSKDRLRWVVIHLIWQACCWFYPRDWTWEPGRPLLGFPFWWQNRNFCFLIFWQSFIVWNKPSKENCISCKFCLPSCCCSSSLGEFDIQLFCCCLFFHFYSLSHLIFLVPFWCHTWCKCCLKSPGIEPSHLSMCSKCQYRKD